MFFLVTIFYENKIIFFYYWILFIKIVSIISPAIF